MEENRKGGIKKLLESIVRPFKALSENDEENDIDVAELEELKRIQANLGETDYTSNIVEKEKEFIPEIKTKTKHVQRKDIGDFER